MGWPYADGSIAKKILAKILYSSRKFLRGGLEKFGAKKAVLYFRETFRNSPNLGNFLGTGFWRGTIRKGVNI